MPKWLDWLPLFVFPLVLFYILGESPGWFPDAVAEALRGVTNYNHVLPFIGDGIGLPSGTKWRPTIGQAVILIGVILLYVELFKSTQTHQTSIIDHMLSTFVFIGYFAFFLSKEWAVNEVFFVLMAMSFLDVVAGFTITISTARRDFSLGGLGGG